MQRRKLGINTFVNWLKGIRTFSTLLLYTHIYISLLGPHMSLKTSSLGKINKSKSVYIELYIHTINILYGYLLHKHTPHLNTVFTGMTTTLWEDLVTQSYMTHQNPHASWTRPTQPTTCLTLGSPSHVRATGHMRRGTGLR